MNKEEQFHIRAKEISKELNLSIYETYQKFMFEKLLERISVSKYQDNFILKGGLLLSAMMGIENRSTRDMDTLIKGINIDKETMINVLNEILSIDLNDGVKFDIINITNIREEDEYGGNRYSLTGRIGNTKITFDIDISTGDIITPRELKFKYNCLFENKAILISAYNLSTIFAEKLETILKKGKKNSRMKDYYDLYYFISRMEKELDKKELKQAIQNTFQKRNSIELLDSYQTILEDIQNSNLIYERWNVYSKKNPFVKEITFNIVISNISEYLRLLF